MWAVRVVFALYSDDFGFDLVFLKKGHKVVGLLTLIILGFKKRILSSKTIHCPKLHPKLGSACPRE